MKLVRETNQAKVRSPPEINLILYLPQKPFIMRKILFVIGMLFSFATIHAQKTEHKNGMIQVDGKDCAKN
jgi:hypothetical protein